MKLLTEEEIVTILRKLEQEKLWYACIILGQDYLFIYPTSIFIKEEIALCYYWINKPNLGLELLNDIKNCYNLDEKTFIRTISNMRFFKQKLLSHATTEMSPCSTDSINNQVHLSEINIKEGEGVCAPSPRDVYLRASTQTGQSVCTAAGGELSNVGCGSVHSLRSQGIGTRTFQQRGLPNGLSGLFTFSITSCRRLSLFIETINSFITNFSDIKLISRWICIDDNSTVEDRIIMKQKFPFFEFIFKPIDRKGHSISMQILADIVTTPYLIHIEDDRILLPNNENLSNIISIFNENSNIGQVCYNINYIETLDDNIKGGLLKKTKNGLYYYQHEYFSDPKEQLQYGLKYGPNCSYYPHFSLSPSVIKTSIFKNCKFKQEISFEFNFGLQYVKNGFLTCFLPNINFIHKGRLTKDIFDYTKLNAYDLVNSVQFSHSVNYKCFVINLDRRKDRMKKILQQQCYLPFFTRFSAIDGNSLIYNHTLGLLCKHGNYNMRPGVIGCALSHLTLYHQLFNDNGVKNNHNDHNPKDIDGYIIFEDDVVVTETFYPSVKRILTIFGIQNIKPDIIFFTTVPKNFNSHIFTQTGIIRKTSVKDISLDSNGGTGCYYISKKGAMAVFTYLEQNTLDVPIDMVLFNLAPYISIYFIFPPIITQYDKDTISDVQNDYYEISSLLIDHNQANLALAAPNPKDGADPKDSIAGGKLNINFLTKIKYK